MIEQSALDAILQSLPAEPPGTGGWRGHPDYYPIYHAVVGLLEPRSVLEIGTFIGDMLVTMLHAAPTITRLAWVDNESDCAGTNAMAERNIAHYLTTYEPGRTLRREWRDDVGAIAGLGRFDLVHVDGDHSFAGCQRDLAVALDCARPRVILADDITWSAGVGAAVRTFAAERGFAAISVPSRHGLAVMFPRVKLPRRPLSYFDSLAALGLSPDWIAE